MRTLFWCGCALAVTAASLVYLAADHAYRYPESVVGRCVLVGYRVATDCNPVVRLSQAVSQCAGEAAREVMSVATCKGAKTCCAPTACQEPCPENGADQPESVERPVDVIDLTNYQIPVQQGADPAADVLINVPEIHSASILFGVGVNSDAGMTSEILIQEPPCQPPCLLEEYEIPPTTIEIEKVKPQGDHEESEAINEGEPPTCQEDPSSYHQYPGCPHMGGCPSSSHCPVQLDPTPVTPKKAKKHKTKKAEPKPEPAKPVVPEAESGSEEQEPQAEVDTMEFRKSDARKDEFKPGPF